MITNALASATRSLAEIGTTTSPFLPTSKTPPIHRGAFALAVDNPQLILGF